jgi:hypothetical protein
MPIALMSVSGGRPEVVNRQPEWPNRGSAARIRETVLASIRVVEQIDEANLLLRIGTR